ncbi:MAG: DMT family transporter [Asticcacaulis sp.]
MSVSSLIKLVVLAAIWGGSFLFMRIAAPVLGPVVLIAVRVGLGALFLLGLAMMRKSRLDVRANGRHFLILGFVNTALPFTLFAFAAESLPASLLSILNATAPIWGAIVSALWLRTAFTLKAGIGLLLGICGVAILVGFDSTAMTPATIVAIAAGLTAGLCYGVASVYAKQAKSVEPFANAHGSLWAACLWMAPVTPFFLPHAMPGLWVGLAVAALGIVCSGVAYSLYFGLIEEIGAAPTLSVGFLIPVFGILWGSFILHEQVTWRTLVGGLIVLIGTALITGFNPMSLMRRRVPA